MSRIFLSHSSQNNAQAVALCGWLRAEGWDDVFLDVDPERGITAGERWERSLNTAADRCEAVLFLVSKPWLESDWCLREFNLAHRLNKRLFGVLIEDVPLGDLPANLTGTWQTVRLYAGRDHRLFRTIMPVTGDEVHVTFSAEGLLRLRAGLQRAGLDPRFFPWPPGDQPDRPPYPGLRPLDLDDAGIFFGREAPVVAAMDRLRGLAAAAPPRLMVILGASGAGKSSFLRAGLLPRLARDDRVFLPLPVLRPQRAAISGDTGLMRALEIACRPRMSRTRAAIRAAVANPAALGALLTELAQAHEVDGAAPVLVLPFDQGEELFLPEGAEEAGALLDLLRGLLLAEQPGMMVLVTIRSNSYERLQLAPALEGVRQETLSLPPMPRGAYQSVIEGPAARAHSLKIDPALTQALLTDIESGGGRDALPLLAFTLERLFLEYGASGQLTLPDYEALGRIGGSIEAAVERALAMADADPRIPADRAVRLTLLRRGLIPWLAGIDPDTRAPRRRVARLSEIPAEARPLTELLVEQRLLSTDVDSGTGEAVIEPAHEALLRRWGLLQGWLEEDFGALTALEGVQRAAHEWEANGRDDDWLAHAGARLAEAERLLTRPDLAASLAPAELEYLQASLAQRAAEQQRKEREAAAELQRERDLADSARRLAAEQRRRTHTARRWGVASGVAALLALVLAVGLFGAMREARERTLSANRLAAATARQTARAQAALAHVQNEKGETIEAAVEALAGLTDPVTLNADPSQLAAWGELERASLGGGLGPIRHLKYVATAAFDPSGKRVVTASSDKTARVWDASTARPVGLPMEHFDALKSASFDPSGTRVVTASNDGTARVWDASTGRPIGPPMRHADLVLSASFDPSGTRVVTASKDGTARVWDAATGQPIGAPMKHDRTVMSASFDPSGKWVVTASLDETARVWDATTGQPIGPPMQHMNIVESASFDPSGARVVTASHDKTARVWDAITGQPIGPPMKHDRIVWSASFDPSGKEVVTASSDGTARLWDASTGQPIGVPMKHGEMVLSASFDPSGARVVTASSDGTARVWDASNGWPIGPPMKHEDAVHSASFDPSGTRVLTAYGGTARVWDATAEQPVGPPMQQEEPIQSASYDPSSTREVIVFHDGTARVWDPRTGQPIGLLMKEEKAIWSALFDRSGTRVVTASVGGTARVWDAGTGQPIGLPMKLEQAVWFASFDSSGTRVVTASHDKTARVWNPSTGQPVGPPMKHPEAVEYAVFDPSGGRVVTASVDGTARVWDALTGRPIGPPMRHGGLVKSASFDPSGTRVLTASVDGTARVWDPLNGQPIAPPMQHEKAVLSAAFDPSGTRVVTISVDGTVRVSDARTGQPIGPAMKHEESILSASFDRSGTHVVTVCRDGTTRVWNAPPLPGPELVDHVRVLLGPSAPPPLRMPYASERPEPYAAILADGFRTLWAEMTGRIGQ